MNGGKNILENRRFKNTVVTLAFAITFFIACIYLYENQEAQSIKLEEQKNPGIKVMMPNSEISTLIVEEDQLYVGGRDGIFILDSMTGEMIETLTTELSLVYTASMIKVNDDLWVGHEKGISVYINNQWIHFLEPEIPKGRCNKIVEINNLIYGGLQEGAVVFDKNSDNEYFVKEIITKKSGLAENNVNAIFEDQKNNIWFGSYLSNDIGGISIRKNQQWQYISIEENLAHKYVTDIKSFEFENEEYVMVGCGHLTNGGLSLFKTTQETVEFVDNFFVLDGMPGEKIRALYVSFCGDIWITTESDGLMITKPENLIHHQVDRFVYLNKFDGLSDNEIKVVKENSKYYILGGRYGVTFILKNTIEEATTY